MNAAPSYADVFVHIRIIVGMVLGLSLARLVNGPAANGSTDCSPESFSSIWSTPPSLDANTSSPLASSTRSGNYFWQAL
jgi:hypothetical protein